MQKRGQIKSFVIFLVFNIFLIVNVYSVPAINNIIDLKTTVLKFPSSSRFDSTNFNYNAINFGSNEKISYSGGDELVFFYNVRRSSQGATIPAKYKVEVEVPNVQLFDLTDSIVDESNCDYCSVPPSNKCPTSPRKVSSPSNLCPMTNNINIPIGQNEWKGALFKYVFKSGDLEGDYKINTTIYERNSNVVVTNYSVVVSNGRGGFERMSISQGHVFNIGRSQYRFWESATDPQGLRRPIQNWRTGKYIELYAQWINTRIPENPNLEMRIITSNGLVEGYLYGGERQRDTGAILHSYISADIISSNGLVLNRLSNEMVGKLRKLSDNRLYFDPYRPLRVGENIYYYLPANGVTGNLYDRNKNPLPYFIKAGGKVNGIFKRFFGQITSNGFRPAYTAQVGAQIFDINFDPSRERNEIYRANGDLSDYTVRRNGNTYQILQGDRAVGSIAVNNPVVVNNIPHFILSDNSGNFIGFVKPTDFAQQPTVSFQSVALFLNSRRQSTSSHASGLRRQDFEDLFPGETFGPPSGGIILPTGPGFINTHGEPGGGVGVPHEIPSSPISFVNTIPLEPSTFDIPTFLGPDTTVAAGQPPTQMPEVIVNDNGGFQFSGASGRFDMTDFARIPIIGNPDGTTGNIERQVPEPMSPAQLDAVLTQNNVRREELNPHLQDLPASVATQFVQTVAETQPQPTVERISIIINDPRRGSQTFEIPRTSGGILRINNQNTDVNVNLLPNGGVNFYRDEPARGSFSAWRNNLGVITASGDFVYGIEYLGRRESNGEFRPNLNINGEFLGLGDTEAINVDANNRISRGPQETSYSIDDISTIRDSRFGNRAVGWINRFQLDESTGLRRVVIYDNIGNSYTNLGEFEQANLLPRGQQATMAFFTNPNRDNRGDVYTIEDNFGVGNVWRVQPEGDNFRLELLPVRISADGNIRSTTEYERDQQGNPVIIDGVYQYRVVGSRHGGCLTIFSSEFQRQDLTLSCTTTRTNTYYIDEQSIVRRRQTNR